MPAVDAKHATEDADRQFVFVFVVNEARNDRVLRLEVSSNSREATAPSLVQICFMPSYLIDHRTMYALSNELDGCKASGNVPAPHQETFDVGRSGFVVELAAPIPPAHLLLNYVLPTVAPCPFRGITVSTPVPPALVLALPERSLGHNGQSSNIHGCRYPNVSQTSAKPSGLFSLFFVLYFSQTGIRRTSMYREKEIISRLLGMPCKALSQQPFLVKKYSTETIQFPAVLYNIK